MGFLDALLGGRGKKVKGAAPDRLFAMTTANVTLETGLGLKHRETAGIVFQPLGTADFESLMKETEELLACGLAHSQNLTLGTKLELKYVGLNHSDSTLVMRLPKEKIIFVVDLIPVASIPGRGMIDFYPLEAEASIKQILSMDWERLINQVTVGLLPKTIRDLRSFRILGPSP